MVENFLVDWKLILSIENFFTHREFFCRSRIFLLIDNFLPVENFLSIENFFVDREISCQSRNFFVDREISSQSRNFFLSIEKFPVNREIFLSTEKFPVDREFFRQSTNWKAYSDIRQREVIFDAISWNRRCFFERIYLLLSAGSCSLLGVWHEFFFAPPRAWLALRVASRLPPFNWKTQKNNACQEPITWAPGLFRRHI